MNIYTNYIKIKEKNIYQRGVTACILVSLAASFLANHYGGSVMVYALMLGIFANFLYKDIGNIDGINFSSSFVLRVGVALLGVKIFVNDVVDLGWLSIAIILFGLFNTILIGYILSRLLKVDEKLGLLSGGAVSICGISAAMALSSVMPRSKEMEQFTATTVIMVAAFGSMLMVGLPYLVSILGLNTEQAAMLIGGSIHDVSHVVGAGFTVSNEVGELAVVIKMLRVAMLVPITWIFLIIFKQQREEAKQANANYNISTNQVVAKKFPLPWFLSAFIIIAIINNVIVIPKDISEMISDTSRWCFIIALVSLGMKTSFSSLLNIGWRPIVLILGESFYLVAIMLFWVMM